MQPEERDKAYLWDMLDAVKAIRSFTDALSYEQYLRDRKVQMAVERALEIIGEAARKVSDRTKAGQNAIPGNPSSLSAMSLPMSMARSGKTGSGPW